MNAECHVYWLLEGTRDLPDPLAGVVVALVWLVLLAKLRKRSRLPEHARDVDSTPCDSCAREEIRYMVEGNRGTGKYLTKGSGQRSDGCGWLDICNL